MYSGIPPAGGRSRVYEFPPPPKAGSSKSRDHYINGNASSSSPMRQSPSRNILAHQRTTSLAQSEDMHVDSESDDEADELVDVHLEVRLQDRPTGINTIRMSVKSYLENTVKWLEVGQEFDAWKEIPTLRDSLERMQVTDLSNGATSVPIEKAILRIHTYTLDDEPTNEQFISSDDSDDERISGGTIRNLPSTELEGLWDNLVYSDDIKARLLRYVESTIAFSDVEIDFNVVTWNRMILLHGPPGTGKTSLCRALAQKLTIRLSDRFQHGRMVEINSHSLFSKWFSESGKLVQNLFSSIHDMADDDDCLVVVMIDEVESLTAARSAAMQGNEPGDAVRVVNALLTQLDKLKTRKNVLVMATSNMAGAIDSAFVDRADIKEYVGLPPPQAIYWILSSCLQQLQAGNLVKHASLPLWGTACAQAGNEANSSNPGPRLIALATACHNANLSGRFLRRLPLLAHARYITKHGNMSSGPGSVRRWIEAMSKVVQDEEAARTEMSKADGQSFVE